MQRHVYPYTHPLYLHILLLFLNRTFFFFAFLKFRGKSMSNRMYLLVHPISYTPKENAPLHKFFFYLDGFFCFNHRLVKNR